MAKLPALQFYPGDWRKDIGVQSLTFHDRGIWFEMLMLMHESEQRGRLVLNGRPMPRETLARILGLDLFTLESTLKVILDYGVAGEEQGVIFCRRMLRDEEKRSAQAESGRLGGNPKLCEGYNKPGFLYAVQRASDGRVKIGISDNPTKRLYKLRYLAKGDNLEMLAFKHVPDMGAAEKEQHLKYAHCAQGEWFSLAPNELESVLSTLKGKPKADGTPSSSSSTTELNKGEGSEALSNPELVRQIVCAHPKSILRRKKPNEVSPAEETAVLQAMSDEIQADDCTAGAALAMMLARTKALADKVPRERWRFVKDVAAFYRAHDYRLELEHFMGETKGVSYGKSGSNTQSAAGGRVARSQAAWDAAAEQRLSEAFGDDVPPDDGSVPAPGAGCGDGEDISAGRRGSCRDLRPQDAGGSTPPLPHTPKVLSAPFGNQRGVGRHG